MPTLRTSAAPATDLFYYEQGTGRPVVLIHGWPLSHRMWHGQIHALADAGFRVVAYDRRGFGDSGQPDGGYDYDTFTSDLNDVIEQLDLRDAAIAGFSMGGGEVARWFGRYGTDRVSQALLLGAVPPFLLKTPDNPEGVDGSVFDGMLAGVRQDREGFFDGFVPQFFSSTPERPTVGNDVIENSRRIQRQARKEAVEQCIVAFGKTDFRADLAKIRVPTLVVHGDDDRIVPFEVSGRRSAKLIEGARLEVIQGAPHGFTETHGDRLNELMLGFLRR